MENFVKFGVSIFAKVQNSEFSIFRRALKGTFKSEITTFKKMKFLRESRKQKSLKRAKKCQTVKDISKLKFRFELKSKVEMFLIDHQS